MNDPADRNERVMALAEEVLQVPPSERDSFLQSACQNDPELYQEISEVVAWEERMSGFLSRPLIELIDFDPPEKPFEPGQTVSERFEILRRVGEGGMGVVYEAFDTKREQRIAIKSAKPGFGRLLSPELKGALRVRHPNVCLVNEIHTAETEFGGLDFLTMEFLDGETLASRLAREKLDEAEALAIARQLCAGAAEAHRSGVLHRDLKPGNVILCRNRDGSTRAVITDFGLSTDGAAAGEAEGGTLGYMAPEVRRGDKASQASDVFSLGVVLYEMITGQEPFPAVTRENGTVHHPTAPRKLVKNLPRRWDAAILPCLRPEPEERCSAEQILHALDRKPLYRRLALAVTTTMALAALATPGIIDLLTPPPIRLAVLPVVSPGDLDQTDQRILEDVAGRVRSMQAGKATISVISPSKLLGKGLVMPQETKKVLGATHALQLKLYPEGDGVNAEGTIIDLSTMAHVRDYSGHFAKADLADLRTGLTGFIGWALHVHRTVQPETVATAATTAYKTGREYLDRQPHDFMNAAREFEDATRLDPHLPLPAAGLA
jgi:serine/threonine protein kinase